MSKKKKMKSAETDALEQEAQASPDTLEALPPPSVFLVLAVAFCAGAALMAVEIVGGRIVAAHFGSHIFVWGGLIGIFMGALSLGYFLGGRLADRIPRFAAMGAVLFLAGIFVLFVPLIADAVCRAVGDLLFPSNAVLANRWNPTVAIILIFGAPAVLLGAASPFTVRLLAREIGTMGRVTARVYALNAMGSIVGTVATAFFLMSVLGNTAILLVVAVLLLLFGAFLAAFDLVASRKAGLAQAPIPPG